MMFLWYVKKSFSKNKKINLYVQAKFSENVDI